MTRRRAPAMMREVLEVRSVIGEGVPGDPAREITTYWAPDGTFLAERDPWIYTADGLREMFTARGWSIHYMGGDELRTGDVSRAGGDIFEALREALFR